MASVVRTAGRVLLGIVALFVVAVVALYAVGSSRVGRTYSTDVDPATVSTDSATVALGHYVVMTHGCTDCHGADLSGTVVADAPPFRMVASNLTSGKGGVGSTYTDADLLRAIRHGVKPDGTGLFMMPSSAYWALSDIEAGAVVSYLRSVPPVDNELPASEIKPMGKIIAAIDKTFISEAALVPKDRERPFMPERGPTAEWGEYRTQVICSHCHGADLHGGRHPDPEAPPGLPLDSVKGWTLDQFIHTMRTGETPDGRTLSHFMPWVEFARMTDDELTAIYLRLQRL